MRYRSNKISKTDEGERVRMKEVEKEKQEQGRTDEQENTKSAPVSETWAQETIEDLDDFIESQGIYIRQ